MAANMLSKGDENVKNDLIQQFCSITGATETVGTALLEACNGNLELAIGMHMDGGGDSESSPLPPSASNAGSSNSSSTSLTSESENVRAPIPQKHEVLVDAPRSYGVKRRRGARSVFDGFRDFQAEARQQQEAASTSTSQPPQHKKRKTLEDLFRPPIDIMQKGTFQSARDVGASNKKWLMVNIQNVQEFSCQVLNRDVWSNPTVKALIRRHFIFWQVYHDSEEGQRYSQFYKCPEFPYVAILDPRTGEFLVSWSKIDAASFCDLVRIFLCEHPSLDGETTSTETTETTDQDVSIVDASEDSQMAAAIRASLEETTSPITTKPTVVIETDDSDPGSDIDLETFTDSDSEVPTPHKKYRTSPSKTSSGLTTGGAAVKRNIAGCLDNDVDSVQLSSGKQTDSRQADSGQTDSRQTDSQQADSWLNHDSNYNKETVLVHDQSSSDSVSICSSVSNNDKEPTWTKFLGKDEDCVTSLNIRLPCGKRKQIKWPSTTKLKALILYVLDCGYSSDRYELITNYPRRQISHMDFNDSLKDAGLHPQETVFVQERHRTP